MYIYATNNMGSVSWVDPHGLMKKKKNIIPGFVPGQLEKDPWAHLAIGKPSENGGLPNLVVTFTVSELERSTHF